MQASNTSFMNVLGMFQYEIPYFQRSYVWKQEQIAKFQEDMLYVSEEYLRYQNLPQAFEYFMGTIISKNKVSNKGYQILELVDGQLTYTRKSCHFRSKERSDNEAQNKKGTCVQRGHWLV